MTMMGVSFLSLICLLLVGTVCSTSSWESRPSGSKPALYYYLNGTYIAENSANPEPTGWSVRFGNCPINPLTKRCITAKPFHLPRRNLRRKLQTSNDGYVRVLFGDSADVSQEARDIFNKAADFWNLVIAANGLRPFQILLADPVEDGFVNVNFGPACGISQFEETFTVNNIPVNEESQLHILARVQAIDGPGGTLAAAGPCLTADDAAGNPQTYVGIMTFDIDDFNNQLAVDQLGLENTVLHEMGHVVGIGTRWKPNLIQNPVFDGIIQNPGNIPTFTGVNAIEGHTLMGFSGPIFVENNGGQGTADAHWEESVFQNELMTGFLDSGANPMSIMTVKSLLDIGLTVNECTAQDFGDFQVDPVECINFINPNNDDDPDNGNTGDPNANLGGLSGGAVAAIVLFTLGIVASVLAVGFVQYKKRSGNPVNFDEFGKNIRQTLAFSRRNFPIATVAYPNNNADITRGNQQQYHNHDAYDNNYNSGYGNGGSANNYGPPVAKPYGRRAPAPDPRLREYGGAQYDYNYGASRQQQGAPNQPGYNVGASQAGYGYHQDSRNPRYKPRR